MLVLMDGNTGRAGRLASELGLDPTDTEEATGLARLAWVDRDYARVLEIIEQVDAGGLVFFERGLMAGRATALYQLGDPSAAAVADTLLASIDPETMRVAEIPALRATAHSIAGRRDEALREADEAARLIRRWDDHVIFPRFARDVVEAYGRIGELEAGFALLDELVDRPGEQFSVTTLRLLPRLDPYRDDPRFDDLIRRREAFEAEGRQKAEAGRPWLP